MLRDNDSVKALSMSASERSTLDALHESTFDDWTPPVINKTVYTEKKTLPYTLGLNSLPTLNQYV